MEVEDEIDENQASESIHMTDFMCFLLYSIAYDVKTFIMTLKCSILKITSPNELRFCKNITHHA